MKFSKAKTYARLKMVSVFLLGASIFPAWWMVNLYNQIDGDPGNTHIIDAKTEEDVTPTYDAMTQKRAQFTHEQVHPHVTEKGGEMILKMLIDIGITPDMGTLELIDTMAEHYNKTSLMVTGDIRSLAKGNYNAASSYGVSMERRLAGDTHNAGESQKLIIKNLRYQIIQTWKDDPSGNWKIGQKIFEFGEPTPKRRVLPDDPRLAVQSFLDVMPAVMSSNSPVTRLNEESDPLKLHRVR